MKNVLWTGAELIRISGSMVKFLLLGLLAGAVLTLLNIPFPLVTALLAALRRIYELVGVAIVGLLPLSIWAVCLGIKHLRNPRSATQQEIFDYDYIASAAPTWGLLGTVVALVMAGAAMATRISEGSSAEMIIGIIPMVAQALISTVVGLVIQWTADTSRHLVERQQIAQQSGEIA